MASKRSRVLLELALHKGAKRQQLNPVPNEEFDGDSDLTSTVNSLTNSDQECFNKVFRSRIGRRNPPNAQPMSAADKCSLWLRAQPKTSKTVSGNHIQDIEGQVQAADHTVKDVSTCQSLLPLLTQESPQTIALNEDIVKGNSTAASTMDVAPNITPDAALTVLTPLQERVTQSITPARVVDHTLPNSSTEVAPASGDIEGQVQAADHTVKDVSTCQSLLPLLTQESPQTIALNEDIVKGNSTAASTMDVAPNITPDAALTVLTPLQERVTQSITPARVVDHTLPNSSTEVAPASGDFVIVFNYDEATGVCTNTTVTPTEDAVVSITADPSLITPPQENIVQKVPPARGPPPSTTHKAAPGCEAKVRRNLFQEAQLMPLSEVELDDCALILPLEEPVSLDNIMSVEVVDNETDNNSFIPETEEHNINNDGRQGERRRRTSTDNDKTPARKRTQTPANWKRTKAKKSYNAGLAHVSKAGKEKRARILKPPCPNTCRKRCYSRVSEELRQKIFNKYWSLGQDKTAQWLFIGKMVRMVPVKGRKVFLDDDDEAWRKHSYEYFLNDYEGHEDAISVCQTMFINTFDISTKSVKTALTKNSPDKRGKHPNHKKTDSLLTESVKEHIKKFPLVQSHYCRADTQRKYLDENLCVAQMHRMYLLERAEDALNTASLRQYRDIFNTCFNLSFFKPKKDQCSFCIEYNTPNRIMTEAKILEYNLHLQEKDRIRALKKEDKLLSQQDGVTNIRVVTFDLQKILYCPKAENAEFYYKRKLSSFNFTLFDCSVKQGYCYVWDLTLGRKGSDEVASFLLDYIESMVKAGIKDFRFYSDSCAGQNKNKYLFCMYYLAAMKYDVKITHRWLVKGHTQMECDNVHARIEKKTKNLQIFTPSEWYGRIRAAKVKKPAYIVKEVSKDVSILTFKPLERYFSWGKVPISKLREITFDSQSAGKICYRTECDGPISEVTVLAKVPGRPVNWGTHKLQKAYSGKLALKPKLLNDLKWYVDKNFIPEAHLEYYRYLLEEPRDAVETEEEEDDMPQEITPALGVNQDSHPDEDIDDPNQIPLPAQPDGEVDGPVTTDYEVSDEEDAME